MTRFSVALFLFATLLICNSCGSQGRDSEQAHPGTPGEVVIPVSEQAGLIEKAETVQMRQVPNIIRVPGLSCSGG